MTSSTPLDPPDDPLDLAENRYARREVELLDELAARTAECDALAAERDGLAAERDALLVTRDAPAADRDAAPGGLLRSERRVRRARS